ncbi:arginine--tRNA ligase [Pelagibacteraceae bacterium]|nr:arginine--tRNA ligase [Pelagibacteraceae bacterium]
MNSYIQKLLNFFYDITDELLKNNLISDINKNQINVDYLSDKKLGDVASNFYLIIKKKILDKNFDFEDYIQKKTKSLNFIDRYEISKNGFINIYLDKNFILNSLNNIYKNDFLKEIKFKKNKNINIEFVSANPTGPIHIAHIRGAVFGDVLSNLYNKMGYNVTREYYVNDAGSQINILANSLYKRYLELFDKKIELLEDEYPGEYLIEIAKEILTRDGDKWLQNNKDDTLKYFKNYSVNTLITKIKTDLKLLNINFDQFTHESDIEKSRIIENLLKVLKEKKLIYEGTLPKPRGEDADWEPRKQLLFKSSKLLDDQDRALKKANGEWTYFANDAAYHYNKFKRNYDKLINIWGSDHIGYIPRMKSLLLAIKGDYNYFDVLTCQIVSLIQNNNRIKMSKREGNFITLENVFSNVGKDPIRYYMISTRNETSIDFDLDAVIKKNKDNNVFYCQYAYARASSVINKAKDINIDLLNLENLNIDVENISEDEWKIIKNLISYPYLLYQSTLSNEPHRLTNYLEDICAQFHSIWNKGKENQSLRFIDEKNIVKTQIKLFWIQSFRVVLFDIFSIIGIDSPEKM